MDANRLVDYGGWGSGKQDRTNLSQTNWTASGSAITATNSALTASDAMTDLHRFYRVVLLP